MPVRVFVSLLVAAFVLACLVTYAITATGSSAEQSVSERDLLIYGTR